MKFKIFAVLSLINAALVFQASAFGSEAERNRQNAENCKSNATQHSGGNGQTGPMCKQAIYNQCLADDLCDLYPDKCQSFKDRVPVSCNLLSNMGDSECPVCN